MVDHGRTRDVGLDMARVLSIRRSIYIRDVRGRLYLCTGAINQFYPKPRICMHSEQRLDVKGTDKKP